MWLDRLSGHSTPSGPPSPQSRSFSPAPRRPSHLGSGAASRPGFSPRSSSLNVSAKFNSSTTSINSPRLPNGSGLKQQFTPPVDFADPLKVLEEIIGSPSHGSSGQQDTPRDDGGEKRPARLVEDIDFKGLGLHDFMETADDVGTLDEHNATQTAEECEYVCSRTSCGI